MKFGHARSWSWSGRRDNRHCNHARSILCTKILRSCWCRIHTLSWTGIFYPQGWWERVEFNFCIDVSSTQVMPFWKTVVRSRKLKYGRLPRERIRRYWKPRRLRSIRPVTSSCRILIWRGHDDYCGWSRPRYLSGDLLVTEATVTWTVWIITLRFFRQAFF